MAELLSSLASLVLGLLLGGAFFGGLWATVSRLDQVRQPVYWLLASGLARFGLMFSVLLLAARSISALYLMVVVVGVLLARFATQVLVVYSIRSSRL